MKFYLLLFTLIYSIILSNGCTSDQTRTLEDVQAKDLPNIKLTEADIEELKNIAKIHQEAALAGDWEKWITTCTDDIVLLPPNDKVYIGKENALIFLKSFPEIIEFSINVEDLKGSNTKAYSWGTANLTVNIAGVTRSSEMKYLAIFEKQADGSWKISRDMWNIISQSAN